MVRNQFSPWNTFCTFRNVENRTEIRIERIYWHCIRFGSTLKYHKINCKKLFVSDAIHCERYIEMGKHRWSLNGDRGM